MSPNEEQAILAMLGEQTDRFPDVKKKYDAIKYRYDKVMGQPLSTETLAIIVGWTLECPKGEEPVEAEHDDSMDGDKLCIVNWDSYEREGYYLGWARQDQHKVKVADDDKEYRLVKAEDFITPLSRFTHDQPVANEK